MKFKSVKGMNDILPAEAPLWQFVERSARDHFSVYGYSELRTPILEPTALFQRGVGETTDIVGKEMYTFEDKGGDLLTMRPEGTASIVRAVIEHNLINHTSPDLKIYYMGPMYRRERPQKGRYRQFHQIGVENFGSFSPEADADVIHMVATFLNKLGVTNWTLLLNSLGTLEERKVYQNQLKNFLSPHEDKFCDDCRVRLVKNTLRVLDCKNPTCIELTKNHPSILDVLGQESRDHFQKVQHILSALNVSYQINPKMVRGLDYYQKTVFEFVSSELGAQSTIAAGGRYEGLVEDLGGPALPGVGFAMGVERLLLLMPPHKFKEEKFYVATMGDQAREVGLALIQKLRQAGRQTEWDYEGRSLKSQLKRADRFGATCVLILGDEELSKSQIQVKNFLLGTQTTIPLDQLDQYLGL